jgi:pimeloyl-ACP methyl ester carboxylesterase
MHDIIPTFIETARLRLHALVSGSADAEPVLFIHGNGSSSRFWEETMRALPPAFRAIAPDLRGYGETDPLPVDATLGLDDMVHDLLALVAQLGLAHYHVVGHSMGGGIAMKLVIANPAAVRSLTLVDTMSPYGYSGSKGEEGAPVCEDGAPAGAAGVNPEFVKALAAGDRGLENPMSPRNVLRQFYVKPGFVPANEEALLDSMLSMRVGPDHYPGDFTPSANWPGAAPGTKGIVNAFSRHYFDASALADITPQPPVLWIRGADDLVVSDMAFWDIAALGAMGYVPGYPGVELCPPQPMLAQTRAVLARYAANGGRWREEVIADAGHSPFIEQPEAFNAIFHAHLGGL